MHSLCSYLPVHFFKSIAGDVEYFVAGYLVAVQGDTSKY